jgi:hypothetical protein
MVLAELTKKTSTRSKVMVNTGLLLHEVHLYKNAIREAVFQQYYRHVAIKFDGNIVIEF